MADIRKKVKGNIDGDFFVDTTCINCDTCRQLAPETFEDNGEYSYVTNQPGSQNLKTKATRALLSCPTGSIGNTGTSLTKEVIEQFPFLVEDSVYYCGFNSPKSFGGNSFFVQENEGNWLIDSPKFNSTLVKNIEKMGGLAYIFLSHEDDVAEAEKFASHFSAKRIIHKDALRAQPNAEIILEGEKDREIIKDFLVIATPGHTKGHLVLLYKQKFLFTGDHLYFNRHNKHLDAHDRHCWYSWEEQTRSMEKLIKYDFEWVLAGHGDRGKLKKSEAKEQLLSLVEKMKRKV